jgi:hypothetical protein
MANTSVFAFNDSLGDAGAWGTRAPTVSGTGTTTSTLPVGNIFTRNPAEVWERTGISNGATVTLDLSLVINTTPLPPFGNRSMAWGFLNVEAIDSATGQSADVIIRVRESATAFTGPYQFDHQRTVYGQGNRQPTVNQAWMVRSGAGSLSFADASYQAQGGASPSGFNRIEFTATPGSNWTLRVGRVVLMTGLACNIEPRVVRGGREQSEVVRSFSGVPYPLVGSRLRRYGGTIRGLTDRQVYGDLFPSTAFTPSITAISRIAGVSGEVCVIERALAPAASSIWQQQPVFGLLDGDLSAQRTGNTSDLEGLSDCSFEVTEFPLGSTG